MRGLRQTLLLQWVNEWWGGDSSLFSPKVLFPLRLFLPKPGLFPSAPAAFLTAWGRRRLGVGGGGQGEGGGGEGSQGRDYLASSDTETHGPPTQQDISNPSRPSEGGSRAHTTVLAVPVPHTGLEAPPGAEAGLPLQPEHRAWHTVSTQ